MLKKILFILFVLFSLSAFSQRTKIRLFVQTTGFDSIVSTVDSLKFYTRDTTFGARLIDNDSLNELVDSLVRVGDSLFLYEQGVRFAVYAPLENTTNELITNVSLTAQDSLSITEAGITRRVYLEDLDSLNELVDSLVRVGDSLFLYEQGVRFRVYAPLENTTNELITNVSLTAQDSLSITEAGITRRVYLEDLDSLNELVDSLVRVGDSLFLYEQGVRFRVYAPLENTSNELITNVSLTAQDSLSITEAGITRRVYLEDLDSTNERVDSIRFASDTLKLYEGGRIVKTAIKASDADWFKVGTLAAPSLITDSIYTSGDIRLTKYPNTRSNDTTAHLNSLYTDAAGNVKSARREIIPPALALNVGTVNTGNTVNYYNHYSTQMVNAGLRAIPLANLFFKVLYYDTAIFANVSISAAGVLSYDVISSTSSHAVIDVRFYTK